MTSGRRNPAIYAGLAGAAAWAMPTSAVALTIMGQEVPAQVAAVPFLAGCVLGAVVATGTNLLIGGLGVLSSDKSQAEGPAVEDAPTTSARSAAGVVRLSSARASHVGQASPHRREAPSSAWEDAGNIRVQAPAKGPAVTGQKHAEVTPHRPSNPYVRQAAREKVRAIPEVGYSLTSNDYGDVAQEYVRRRKLSERMASRARGVAEVLGERLGTVKMEGLPVITRADGTVGDVGTAWWDSALGQSQVGSTPAPQVPIAPQAPAGAPVSWGRHVISSRVPSPDEAPVAQPAPTPHEERWTGQQQDLWAVALAALDERFEEQVAMGPDAGVSFGDDAGTGSLEEPGGLEASTNFMAFRPQAGHPEVKDTKSYVSLLVDQELSKVRSREARKSIREHLRLIDGGTADLGKARHLAAVRA